MPILKTALKNMLGGPLSLRPARRSFIDFQSGGEGSAGGGLRLKREYRREKAPLWAGETPTGGICGRVGYAIDGSTKNAHSG